MYTHISHPSPPDYSTNSTRLLFVFFVCSVCYIHMWMFTCATFRCERCYLLISEFLLFELFYRNSGSNHYHDHRAVFESIQRWEIFILLIFLKSIKTHTHPHTVKMLAASFFLALFHFNYLSLLYQIIIISNLFIRSLQVKDRIENLTRKFWEIMEWKNGEMEVWEMDFSVQFFFLLTFSVIYFWDAMHNVFYVKKWNTQRQIVVCLV